MKQTSKTLLLIFLFFGLYFMVDALYFKGLRQWLFGILYQLGISHIITYILTGIPLFLGTALLVQGVPFYKTLGLCKSVWKAFLFAAICTLPMFIGFSIFFEFNTTLSLNTVLISVVAAGFFEELYFRGYLFGLPFLKAKLGFIPAVFFGALLFGLLHLYQSTDPMELLGIFLITFLGGILFAWVYAEWNFNIWVPVFLHLLMNLSWELFSVSNHALGGLYANVFRFITIALIILFTLWYKRKKGFPLVVKRKTLFLQKEEASR